MVESKSVNFANLVATDLATRFCWKFSESFDWTAALNQSLCSNLEDRADVTYILPPASLNFVHIQLAARHRSMLAPNGLQGFQIILLPSF
jgi:hypothetical protein